MVGRGGGGPRLASSPSSLPLPLGARVAVGTVGNTAGESITVMDPTATTTSLRATCEEALLGDSTALVVGGRGLGGVEEVDLGGCRTGEEKGVWSLSSPWLLISVVDIRVSSLDADER